LASLSWSINQTLTSTKDGFDPMVSFNSGYVLRQISVGVTVKVNKILTGSKEMAWFKAGSRAKLAVLPRRMMPP
jgi:hypothetical protein